MHGLVDKHRQLLLRLYRRGKCLFPLFHLISCLLSTEFVVDDFQSTSFFYSAIGSGAVGTVDDFASHGVNGFGERLSLHVFEVWSTKSFDKNPPVWFFQ